MNFEISSTSSRTVFGLLVFFISLRGFEGCNGRYLNANLPHCSSKNDIKARDPSMSHEEFFQRRKKLFHQWIINLRRCEKSLMLQAALFNSNQFFSNIIVVIVGVRREGKNIYEFVLCAK